MIEALQRVEAETTEPICYIISGDLAHIGPKFGDPEPVDEPVLEHSRKPGRGDPAAGGEGATPTAISG